MPIDPGRYAVRETSVTLDGTIQTLVGADPNRIALLISGPFTTQIQISTRGNMPVNGGMGLSTTGEWTEIVWGRHGSLVNQGWFVRGGGLGGVVTAIEVWENPEGGQS